jgi:cytochrome c-type biogenesis protein CcmH
MTLFWLATAVLTAAVVAMLVSPLVRRSGPGPGPGRASYDLEVYRDQLAELDRDLLRGVIESEQAEAARAEIGRRILASTGRSSDHATAGPPSPRANRVIIGALLVVVPTAALVLYLMVGRPDLPAQPLAGRSNPATAGAPPANIADAVAKLAEHLKGQPADLEGWTLLARSLAKLDRPAEAVEAWRHALALATDDPDLQGSLADALTTANGGVVPDEARRLFEAILNKRPGDPQASHFLALAQAQGGDFRGALDRWTALAAASPADAPWLPMVRQAIEDMARHLNLDPAKAIPDSLPARGTAESAPPAAAGPPPTAEERNRMIRSMVDGLAARLATQPDDIAGWLRLARAYQVLGEPDRQLEALTQARTRAPTRPDVLVAYAEALMSRASPAAGARLPPEAILALRGALTVAPDTPEALWYLGLDASTAGQSAEARTLWQRLLGELDPASPDYAEVKSRLDGLP